MHRYGKVGTVTFVLAEVAVVITAAAVSVDIDVVDVVDGVDVVDVVWSDGGDAVRISGTAMPAATIAASNRLITTIMTMNVVMLPPAAPPAAGPATGAQPGHLNIVHTNSIQRRPSVGKGPSYVGQTGNFSN